MFDYADVFRRLSFDTAIITFLKKDGTVRIMLATRNLDTVAIENGYQGNRLGAHDNRCNIKNGNLAVFDLILGDTRAFNISRVLDIIYCGKIDYKEQLDVVIKSYKEYNDAYMAKYQMSLNMETFDSMNEDNKPKVEIDLPKVDVNTNFNGGLV